MENNYPLTLIPEKTRKLPKSETLPEGELYVLGVDGLQNALDVASFPLLQVNDAYVTVMARYQDAQVDDENTVNPQWLVNVYVTRTNGTTRQLNAATRRNLASAAMNVLAGSRKTLVSKHPEGCIIIRQ